MTNAFKVKIPISNTNEFKELIFLHRQQILELLNISSTTFYSIMHNKLKYSRSDKLHLRGVSIEKISIDVNSLSSPPVDLIDDKPREDFLWSILNKVKHQIS